MTNQVLRFLLIFLLLTLPAQILAATFVVDTTLDSTNSLFQNCTSAPSDCNLRGAAIQSNVSPDADRIEFSIPAADDPGCDANTGACTLQYNQGGITFQHAVTLDGYTQPGASVNTVPAQVGPINSVLKIAINAAGTLSFNGPTTLRGMAFASTVAANNPQLNVFGCWFDGTLDGAATGALAGGLNLSGQNAAQNSHTRIGGLDPADRNWFPFGGLMVWIYPPSGQTPTYNVRVEGNLFGLRRDGLSFVPIPNRPEGIRSSGVFGDASTFVIGGTDPNARNWFGNLGTAITGSSNYRAGAYIDGTDQIIGNSFGVGVDGVTPIPNDNAVYNGSNWVVGGITAAEANQFANNGRGVVGHGNMQVLGNTFRNHSECAMCFPLEGATLFAANDPGDADAYAFDGNSVQNYPEIRTVTVVGTQVTVGYLVSSSLANSTYPLTIEFYKAEGDEGAVFLARDTYQTPNVVQQFSFTLPVDVSLSATDMILGTANAARTAAGFSRFTFFPVVTSFVGNSGNALPGQSYPVRLRVQAVYGPYAPRGQVTFTSNTASSFQGCTAQLLPTATAGVSEAACFVQFNDASFGGNSIAHDLSARYEPGQEPFASETGSRPFTVSRSVTLVRNGMFCDGFEDQSCVGSP